MKHRAWIGVLVVAGAAGLIFMACDGIWQAGTGVPVPVDRIVFGDTAAVTLYAGQSIDVGRVEVWNDSMDLHVRYVTTGGWEIHETHLAVATSLEAIPQANGNPIPGHFPYGETFEPPVTEASYLIPLGSGSLASWPVGTVLYIAAHAVVSGVPVYGSDTVVETAWADGEDFPGHNWATYFTYTIQEWYKDISVPGDTVTMMGSKPGTAAYWDIYLSGVPAGYDVWDGLWNGWCAEYGIMLPESTDYEVTLWSSQEPLLPTRIQNDEWDKVNYLLNNKHPAATSIDIQAAIWYLLGQTGLPSDPDALAMIADAQANGEGFRPETGDWIACIALPPDSVQVVFIEVDP